LIIESYKKPICCLDNVSTEDNNPNKARRRMVRKTREIAQTKLLFRSLLNLPNGNVKTMMLVDKLQYALLIELVRQNLVNYWRQSS